MKSFDLESLSLQSFLQSLHKEQWQEVRLGEVTFFQRGYDLSKNQMRQGIYPVAGSNGVIGYHNVSTTKAPCITIGRSGNIGKPKFYTKDFWAHNTTLFVKDFFGNNEKFTFYMLQTMDFSNLNSGSAVPTLNRNHIHEIEVLLPPLTIQQKIAEILSSFDDKIDLLHRQNKTLESLALTLFRHYFIDNPKRDEWEEVSLNSLCEITSSKRIFYSEYVEYGIPFYRSKEIIEFSKGNNPQNELFIDENKYNDIANKFGVPQANDILLTSVGTLGIPYLVPKDKKFYFKDGNLTWFKNFKNITSLFLFYWFKSPQGKEKLDSIAIGSTQQALTIAALKAVNIHLPHTDIIRILNEQLNGIQNKIENNTKQIQNLQAMRDMLLKAIFA